MWIGHLSAAPQLITEQVAKAMKASKFHIHKLGNDKIIEKKVTLPEVCPRWGSVGF